MDYHPHPTSPIKGEEYTYSIFTENNPTQKIVKQYGFKKFDIIYPLIHSTTTYYLKQDK